MTSDAQNIVAYDCARRLETQLLVAPWVPEDDADSRRNQDDEDDVPRGLKILSTCKGATGEPTMAVILDEDGQVVDMLKLNFLGERRANPTASGRDSATDLAQLKTFIQTNQPRAVIVGATDLDCRRYFEDVQVRTTVI